LLLLFKNGILDDTPDILGGIWGLLGGIGGGTRLTACEIIVFFTMVPTPPGALLVQMVGAMVAFVPESLRTIVICRSSSSGASLIASNI
jgi:hypothetical protein